MPQMHPDALKLFYEESKSAHAGVSDLLKQYRANTTTVLTLATGAATFFGFANSPKGIFYVLSLTSYGLAVLLAATIYWPIPWRVNMALTAGTELATPPPLSPAKLTYDLGVLYQQGFAENADRITHLLQHTEQDSQGAHMSGYQ